MFSTVEIFKLFNHLKNSKNIRLLNPNGHWEIEYSLFLHSFFLFTCNKRVNRSRSMSAEEALSNICVKSPLITDIWFWRSRQSALVRPSWDSRFEISVSWQSICKKFDVYFGSATDLGKKWMMEAETKSSRRILWNTFSSAFFKSSSSPRFSFHEYLSLSLTSFNSLQAVSLKSTSILKRSS